MEHPNGYIAFHGILSAALRCSDCRDRIYSHIVLMSPDMDIITNCNKSSEGLFIDIVHKHIPFDLYDAGPQIRALAGMLESKHEDPE